jgi:hypothetical protein
MSVLKHLLFSYGTLQKENVQHKLFGRTLIGSPDKLIGYRIKEIIIKDEAFLAKGEGINQLTTVYTNNESDLVEGIAFKITEAELLLTDQYEPAGYTRSKVLLASGHEAWLYRLAE